MGSLRRRAPDALALLFAASSLVHLIRPKVFEPLIPKWLAHPRLVAYASGAAELICAGGLATRARWSRSASVLLLGAVFPGNIQMALNAAHEGGGHLTRAELLAFGRLPLQVPLIWAAWQAGGAPRPSQSRSCASSAPPVVVRREVLSPSAR